MAQSPAGAQSRREHFMAIDYEVEYNNRARVPEHPQIFARWTREAAAYRDETTKEGRAEIGLKYGPLAAPDHRPVQAEGRRQRPARAVHPRRLLALARARKLQPDGARHERARRHRRGLGLRPLRRRSRIGQIIEQTQAACLYLWKRSASASWSAAIRPAGISPPAWSRPTGRRSTPSAPADLAPAGYAISGLFDLEPLLHLADQRRLQARRRRGAAHLAAVLAGRRGRVLDAVVGGDESSEFLRHSKIIADALARQGRRDALRGGPGDEPLHRLRSDGGPGQRDDQADGGAGEAT